MATPIATVGGIALAPGVSRNRRLYSRKAIASAVARAQDRLESGGLVITAENDPVTGHVITQLTHHLADDDSTKIAGRVTSLALDETGRARFRADIAPTDAGKTIAALLDTSDGQAPFLRGVSIRGQWLGKTRIEKGPDGDPVETADDLEILGLDYTHKPGVPAAVVDTFAWSKNGTRQETDERVLITESVQEALVGTITEDMTPTARHEHDVTEAKQEALRNILAPPRPHVFKDGICITCK